MVYLRCRATQRCRIYAAQKKSTAQRVDRLSSPYSKSETAASAQEGPFNCFTENLFEDIANLSEDVITLTNNASFGVMGVRRQLLERCLAGVAQS